MPGSIRSWNRLSLVGIYDADEARAQEIAAEFGTEAASSLSELISRHRRSLDLNAYGDASRYRNADAGSRKTRSRREAHFRFR